MFPQDAALGGASGTPVITWVTINLTSHVEERYYWTTPNGEDAVFLINEHCVLLCGYDLNANTVTVCDPLEGKVDYDLDKFEDRYSLVYQQAVVTVTRIRCSPGRRRQRR